MTDMIEYWSAFPVQFPYLQVMQLLFPWVQLMVSWNHDLIEQVKNMLTRSCRLLIFMPRSTLYNNIPLALSIAREVKEPLDGDATYFPPLASSSALPTFVQMKNPIAKYWTSSFYYFGAVHFLQDWFCPTKSRAAGSSCCGQAEGSTSPAGSQLRKRLSHIS